MCCLQAVYHGRLTHPSPFFYGLTHTSMSEMQAIEIRAAGGVVFRELDGRVELLSIHRPKYDDWSFPKGKLDPGESFEAAALREVREETGLGCRLDAPLQSIHYQDSHGRLKEVRYWLMSVAGGSVEARTPDAEVDEGRWRSPARTAKMLSYPRDRELLAEAVEILARRNP